MTNLFSLSERNRLVFRSFREVFKLTAFRLYEVPYINTLVDFLNRYSVIRPEK